MRLLDAVTCCLVLLIVVVFSVLAFGAGPVGAAPGPPPG